jgi:hypothetical protein
MGNPETEPEELEVSGDELEELAEFEEEEEDEQGSAMLTKLYEFIKC